MLRSRHGFIKNITIDIKSAAGALRAHAGRRTRDRPAGGAGNAPERAAVPSPRCATP